MNACPVCFRVCDDILLKLHRVRTIVRRLAWTVFVFRGRQVNREGYGPVAIVRNGRGYIHRISRMRLIRAEHYVNCRRVTTCLHIYRCSCHVVGFVKLSDLTIRIGDHADGVSTCTEGERWR